MLTKTDLEQIGQVIEEKLEQKLEEKLEQKLEEKLDKKLEEKLEKKFEEKLAPIRKDLTIIKKDISFLQKAIDVVIMNYDEGDKKLDARITRIEKHLHLPENN